MGRVFGSGLLVGVDTRKSHPKVSIKDVFGSGLRVGVDTEGR